MMSFFKQLIASILGSLIATILMWLCFFVIVGAILISMATLQNSASPDMKPSILVIDMNGSLEDAPPELNPEDAFVNATIGGDSNSFYLLETIEAIRHAAKDSKIAGILIHGNLSQENYGSGLPALRELRKTLDDFSNTGKPVYAYLEAPSQSDYYVASVADKIILNPSGSIPISGLGANMLYLGDAFKKYGVGIQILRTGKYKSAVEMFTDNKMSEAAREQMIALLNPMWLEMRRTIATSRSVSLESLDYFALSQGELLANQALDAGLVDMKGYWDMVTEELETLVGRDEEIKDFYQVSLVEYINEVKPTCSIKQTTGDFIAVVYAEGDIEHGQGYPNDVSDVVLPDTLRDLRNDENCRGVVLRVNSPGGSALASDIIQREMILLKAANKPLVVSMGSYAASGGYWISVFSDRIFADPMTITGSIGVFGLLPNIQEIANRNGVTFDRLVTAPFADIYSATRPKSQKELAVAQESVNAIYRDFLEKVSSGRKLSVQRVGELAEGRVWIGQEAIANGLADEAGGLRDAIDYVARLANVEGDYELAEHPKRMNLEETLESFLMQKNANVRSARVKSPLFNLPLANEIQQMQSLLRSWQDPRHIYARLPWLITLE